MLGALDLRSAPSVPLDRILSQPKRLALLAYLAAATPQGFHRRDTLLALFWPDLDQEHARGALRNTIHFLRRELGPGVVRSRGTDVGLSPDGFWSDVAAFDAALKTEDLEEALVLYRGELLKGVHLTATPDFERWLDLERDRVRRSAHTAARELSSVAEKKGDLMDAAHWLRVALAAVPDDEVSLQRLMRLLDRSGDRAGALHAYALFRDRLAVELEVEPSPESQGLVVAVRARGESAARGDDLPARLTTGHPGETDLPATELNSRRTDTDAARWRRRRRSVLIPALGVVAVIAVSSLSVTARGTRHASIELVPQRVVVAPLQNRTGRPQLSVLGDMAAEWITQGLIEADLAEVVSPANALSAARSIESRASAGELDQVRALAEKTGAGIVVSGAYYLENDTLQWRAEVVDAGERRLLADIGPILGPAARPSVSIGQLRGKVLGAVAALVDPTSDARLSRPHGSIEHVRSLEGQREFKQGLDLFLRDGEKERSLEHFYRAFAIDSMDAAALLQAAFAHSALGQYAQIDAIVARLTPLRTRMGEHDRLWFDLWSAKIAGNRKRALEVNRQLVRLTPRGGWELQGGYQALSARRPREALSILQGGDPDKGLLEGLSSLFELQAEALHVLSEHERELQISLRARARHPQSPSVLTHEVQALAALGRIGEMRDRLRERSSMAPPSALQSPENSSGGIMSIAGAELRVHGNPEASRELFEQAIHWYTQQVRQEPGSEPLQSGLGTALYGAGRWTEAHAVFERLARRHPKTVDYRGFLGVVAARQGRRAQAARIDEALAAWDQRYSFGLITLWRARIAAQLGEPEKAMSLLNEAFAQGLAFGIELHRDVDLDPLRGIPSFRDLLRPRN